MEDHAIRELDEIAASYAEIRDQRMDLTREEASLKDHARRLMKLHKKTIYRHNGVEIRIVAGEEDVKVKIKKQDDPDAEPEPSNSLDVGESEPEREEEPREEGIDE